MKYRAEITTKEQLSAALTISVFEYIYTPLEFLGAKTLEKQRIIAVPPVFIGGSEPLITKELQKLKKEGFKGVLAHTLGHIELIKNAGLSAHGGFRLNITNSISQKQYEEIGLTDGIFSLELPFKSMKHIKRGISMGVMAYGYLPLMITRRCPVRDDKLCGKPGCTALTDRLGNRLQTYCRHSEAEVLNPVPLVLSDKIAEIPADFCVFRFSTGENVTQKPAHEKFTRGLYNKKVK
ncbi:MAG: U32 family peptidase [Oscillospiraceae bacterium]|jgi:putative protease|nr:U32 family peptidase [Oscillospiraceae bacterium]